MWDLLAITAGDSLFSHLNIIIMIFNLINDFTELKKENQAKLKFSTISPLYKENNIKIPPTF